MYALTLIVLIAAALFVAMVRSHLILRDALGAHPATAATIHPPVTVIRPIKGLDYGAARNIQAALDHGYDGEVETIFVFDDETEPAIPIVRGVIGERTAAGFRDNARVIFSGQPPEGRTGKLNAMIAGLREAGGQLIAFADSDIRPDSGALTALVETLVDTPAAGAAFAPVVATEPPVTAGDVGYALMLNGLYGPVAAWAARRGGGELPFIMGQFMIFKRAVIRDICGLESAEGQLVDDMYLGARVKAAGFVNAIAPRAVPIIQRGLPLAEFWKIYLRWITFSLSGLPGRDFKLTSWLRGLYFWMGLVTAAVAAALGFWPAAALAALAPIGIAVSTARLHRAIGGARIPLQHAWVALGILLLAPAVYLRVLTRREIEWRGRRYRLDRDGRLDTGRRLGLTECDGRRVTT